MPKIVQGDLPCVGPGAVFDDENSLPCAQNHFAVLHGNGELRRGQHALDMGGHIIGSLVRMAIIRALRSDAIKTVGKIEENGCVGVLLYGQGG